MARLGKGENNLTRKRRNSQTRKGKKSQARKGRKCPDSERAKKVRLGKVENGLTRKGRKRPDSERARGLPESRTRPLLASAAARPATRGPRPDGPALRHPACKEAIRVCGCLKGPVMDSSPARPGSAVRLGRLGPGQLCGWAGSAARRTDAGPAPRNLAIRQPRTPLSLAARQPPSTAGTRVTGPAHG